MQRPLASLAVIAYNQEKLVHEAIGGALKQTYSPLEILLTDDCSSDKTFEIMCEMASRYRGPHKILLNRNPKNLGTGGHLRRQFELISGEFYVGSAGDDVCLPDRTEKIMAAFLAGRNKVQCVWSNARIIDVKSGDKGLYRPGDFLGLHNEATPVFSTRAFPWVLGATAAFRRTVWDAFGPLDPGIIQEDLAMALRSRLLGEVIYLPEALVLYRRHAGNVYDHDTHSCAALFGKGREQINHAALSRQRRRDIQVAAARGAIPWSNALYYLCVNECLRLLRMPLDKVEGPLPRPAQLWKRLPYRAVGRGVRAADRIVRKVAFAN